jgi:hypothetical protein
MKYRIKETVDGNDKSTFKIQYKFLWWHEAYRMKFSSTELAKNFIRSLQTKEVKYHTVEQ